MTPPTAEELERRLRGRGTETDEVIASRLSRAAEEVTYMEKYDYIVVNETNKVAECAAAIHHLIEDEKKAGCVLRRADRGTFPGAFRI